MNDTPKVWVQSGETLNEDAQIVLLLTATPAQEWTPETLRLKMKDKIVQLMEDSEDVEADLGPMPDVANEARMQESLEDKANAITTESSLADLIRRADLEKGPKRANLRLTKAHRDQTLNSLILSLANAQ